MSLQSQALKTVALPRAGEHPLETCGLHRLRGGGGGRGGGGEGGGGRGAGVPPLTVPVGDGGAGPEARAADGAEEGHDDALERRRVTVRQEVKRRGEARVESHDEVVVRRWEGRHSGGEGHRRGRRGRRVG